MLLWCFEGDPTTEDGEICCVIGHKIRVPGQQAYEYDVYEEEDVHYDVTAWNFPLTDTRRNRVIYRLSNGHVERVPDSSPSNNLLKLYFLFNFFEVACPNMAS